MSRAGYVDGVEVLWRPGCPFCVKLRHGLRRRGIPTTEIDIWKDPGAAERVRAVTGGDETVPTVFVGGVALVNPSVREVAAAVAREFPDRASEMLSSRRDRGRPRWWSRVIRAVQGGETA
ncbi:glutaredoxin domain-containing protein [Mycobacterium spongiae]|uniref:NrdH-redoxin n=1 Tax=Mycobacterium spongiae TaxID=886343 RepID=A0A975K100_9MYCO|nr:glutaredoxin domain-containing protein [Mycobacterium spongiae]QUR68689.1 NrdH-redoxin [Mycobacterium spongiae]